VGVSRCAGGANSSFFVISGSGHDGARAVGAIDDDDDVGFGPSRRR
jgi:hypothetical protein